MSGSGEKAFCAGGDIVSLYHAHVGAVLSHTMEDVYRIQLLTVGKNEIEGLSTVAIQVVSNTTVLPADSTSPVGKGVPLTPKATLPDEGDVDSDGEGSKVVASNAVGDIEAEGTMEIEA